MKPVGLLQGILCIEFNKSRCVVKSWWASVNSPKASIKCKNHMNLSIPAFTTALDSHTYTSYYFNLRNGNTFLITISAPDVTRSSFLALCHCSFATSSPSFSSRLAFHRASSSSVVASFNILWCSAL